MNYYRYLSLVLFFIVWFGLMDPGSLRGPYWISSIVVYIIVGCFFSFVAIRLLGILKKHGRSAYYVYIVLSFLLSTSTLLEIPYLPKRSGEEYISVALLLDIGGLIGITLIISLFLYLAENSQTIPGFLKLIISSEVVVLVLIKTIALMTWFQYLPSDRKNKWFDVAACPTEILFSDRLRAESTTPSQLADTEEYIAGCAYWPLFTDPVKR